MAREDLDKIKEEMPYQSSVEPTVGEYRESQAAEERVEICVERIAQREQEKRQQMESGYEAE